MFQYWVLQQYVVSQKAVGFGGVRKRRHSPYCPINTSLAQIEWRRFVQDNDTTIGWPYGRMWCGGKRARVVQVIRESVWHFYCKSCYWWPAVSETITSRELVLLLLAACFCLATAVACLSLLYLLLPLYCCMLCVITDRRHRSLRGGNLHHNSTPPPLQLIIKTSAAHAVAFHPPGDTNVSKYFISFIVLLSSLHTHTYTQIQIDTHVLLHTDKNNFKLDTSQ